MACFSHKNNQKMKLGGNHFNQKEKIVVQLCEIL